VGYFLTALRAFAAICLLATLHWELGASDSTNLPPCCRKALTNAPYSDKSLFQLDSTWTSDVGREVKLGVFQGRAQVVGLFFTHCEYACPIIVHDMRKIQAALPASLRDRVDFLLVSFDTERDTPAVLADYRKTHKLGTDHWTLLTGKPDDVRELAALLGINYQKDARGQFAHSNVITILNAEGEVIRQQVGLNTGPEESVKALEKALKAKAP
jgi:protein SCO1/2